MKWNILIGICLISVTAHAETMYVDDTIKLGLRQDPGFNHKMTEMIEAGPVEVLKVENDWSYIKLSDGREGWIANRFVTNKKPNSLEVKELRDMVRKKPSDKIPEQNAALIEENKRLKAENERLLTESAEKQKKIKELSNSIAELKTEPKPASKSEEPIVEPKSEVPKPEPKKEEVWREESKKTSDMIDIIRNLEMNQIIKGALVGVGILVIGYIMGSRSSGNRRRRSYY